MRGVRKLFYVLGYYLFGLGLILPYHERSFVCAVGKLFARVVRRFAFTVTKHTGTINL